MKKLKEIIFLSSFTIIPLCVGAQELTNVNDLNNNLAENELRLNKSEIPAFISKDVMNDFKNGEPVQWSLIPELLKTYGLSAGMNDPSGSSPETFFVKFKTTNGSFYEALYSSDGNLIRWKEKLKDGQLPLYIENELLNQESNNWKVVSDVDYIRENKDNFSKHYTVTLKKGNERKTLQFDDKGLLLTNK